MSRLLERLRRLSAAEEFFAALDVPFEQRVVDVNRLHILKRFHDALAGQDVEALDDDTATALLRQRLDEAYRQFAGGAAPAKTFKVFRQQEAGFVPLKALKP